MTNPTGQPATAWAPLLFLYVAAAGTVIAAAGLVWAPLFRPGVYVALVGLGGCVLSRAVDRALTRAAGR